MGLSVLRAKSLKLEICKGTNLTLAAQVITNEQSE
jgi:hypothetical protein